jgi:protein-L-isoaspartate(D-aspartate) O-methyltransferase
MMVDCQLRTFDVSDPALLAAMDEVPRERFVPDARASLAYIDQNIPVAEVDGERRLMLAPMVLARMIQGLALKPGERALDVACGLGYSSAVLARLGVHVTALEWPEPIAAEARSRLAAVAGEPIEVVAGPLEAGHAAGAPYDAILVNGAVDTGPQRLLEQLRDGGRLACVEGAGRAGRAMLYVRSGAAFGCRTLFDAAAPVLSAFRAEPGFVF